jgi:hypothetical protein
LQSFVGQPASLPNSQLRTAEASSFGHETKWDVFSKEAPASIGNRIFEDYLRAIASQEPAEEPTVRPDKNVWPTLHGKN